MTTATFFGDPRIAQPRMNEFRNSISPVDYKVSYINNLHEDVVIGWRSGLKFTFEPERNMTSNVLVIRTEITASRKVKKDLERILSVVGDSATNELKAIRQAYTGQVQDLGYNQVKLVLDYTIAYEDLKKHGGTVYYHETDTVVSLSSATRDPVHPHSDTGRRIAAVSGVKSKHDCGSFYYDIKIVQNDESGCSRFLNFASEIYKIDSHKDPDKRDGVYVVAVTPRSNHNETHKDTVNYLSLEQAEQTMGLYRTYEDALTLGDPEAARKKELTRLEHELAVLKRDNSIESQRHEMELIKAKGEAEKAKLELEEKETLLRRTRENHDYEMNLLRMRDKDYYEQRSYQRKDNSEFLKAIPTIMVGIASVITAVYAVKNGSKK